MYCKIFTSQQVYDGMTDMNIACDNVFVTDGWICLYKDEKLVASFDMVTINGWVLIDSTADTPQTEKTCDNCGTPRDKCVYCIEEDRMWTPQTDCAVITDTSYQVLDGWQTREKPKTTDCPWK